MTNFTTSLAFVATLLLTNPLQAQQQDPEKYCEKVAYGTFLPLAGALKEGMTVEEAVQILGTRGFAMGPAVILTAKTLEYLLSGMTPEEVAKKHFDECYHHLAGKDA